MLINNIKIPKWNYDLEKGNLGLVSKIFPPSQTLFKLWVEWWLWGIIETAKVQFVGAKFDLGGFRLEFGLLNK